MSNSWLPNQDRIQKMDRDSSVQRTPQHQLKRKIDQWADTNHFDSLVESLSGTGRLGGVRMSSHAD